MAAGSSKETRKEIGSYDLLEPIAEGGMGAVYKARHRTSGEVVAIKIVSKHMARNPVLLKRFEKEFRASRKINHPNIVRALDYGEDGGTPYMVMEFVDGETLGARIERQGKLAEAEAVRLVAQTAQGLHKAHKRKLIHRDVKPDNILITSTGEAKLADLGLVKEVDAEVTLTRTGRGLGTPHFMAPEQFRNAKNVDTRSDVYSLGATLYMAVTGELPFRSCSPLDAWTKKMKNDLIPPRQLVPELSERVDRAIRRAMSADPRLRPASCREFVEDLTGRSTRRLKESGIITTSDFWYLYYKDEQGEIQTVKGTVRAIRHSVQQGLLGNADRIQAAPSKAGPFQSLDNYAEFRDLVIAPTGRSATPIMSSEPPPPLSPPPKLGEGPGVGESDAPTTPVNMTPLPGSSSSVSGERGKHLPHFDLGPTAKKDHIDWRALVWVAIGALVTAIVAYSFLTSG